MYVTSHLLRLWSLGLSIQISNPIQNRCLWINVQTFRTRTLNCLVLKGIILVPPISTHKDVWKSPNEILRQLYENPVDQNYVNTRRKQRDVILSRYDIYTALEDKTEHGDKENCEQRERRLISSGIHSRVLHWKSTDVSGYFFDPESGSQVFLWNVGSFSTDYTALYLRRYTSAYNIAFISFLNAIFI
jgi:hypothetical protein